MGKTNGLLIIVIAVIALFAANYLGIIHLGFLGGAPSGGTNNQNQNINPSIQQTCDLSQGGTLTGNFIDYLSGNSSVFNSEVYTANNGAVAGETRTTGVGSSITTSLPLMSSGYLMVGNDNLVSTTDNGEEYYYTKVPWTSGCNKLIGLPSTGIPREGTPTWTIYDDGAAEASPNITVGSGQTVTSTKFKIAASALGFLGNPAFSRPLAICANATTLAYWDAVRPSDYDSKFGHPKFLNTYGMLGGDDCYVLPTGAIKDYGTYEGYLVLDAASGQNPEGTVTLILLDKTYFKDDNKIWKEGWGYDSNLGTSTDIGMAAASNAQNVATA